MNSFYANRYNNQAIEKDGHADADHLYDMGGADGKGNDRANLCGIFLTS